MMNRNPSPPPTRRNQINLPSRFIKERHVSVFPDHSHNPIHVEVAVLGLDTHLDTVFVFEDCPVVNQSPFDDHRCQSEPVEPEMPRILITPEGAEINGCNTETSYTWADMHSSESDAESEVEVPKKEAFNLDAFRKLSWFNKKVKPSRAIPKLTGVSASTPSYLSLMSVEWKTSAQKKKEYRFVKMLDKGVQGSISLRIHTNTGAKVALKVLLVHSGIDPAVRSSFRTEVDNLKLCHDHSNVLQLLDYWEGTSKVYQVSEFCAGGDLEGFAIPLSEQQSACFIAPIFDAVRHLHERGILHRDVRPANIFLRSVVTGNETLARLATIPVLGDFAISVHESISGRLGTRFYDRPAHIAPEVVDGERFGKPADAFGLGVSLVTVLMRRAVTLEDQDPRRMPSDKEWGLLSPQGRKLVRMLLKVDPGQRISPAEALELKWFDGWKVMKQK
ncbi:hypothetical protein HDU98_003147 [Podochytrium sp. JEL0797]|nr:hypothetical protein HDU98_003147 [Podochytrium sp. JEL0797]